VKKSSLNFENYKSREKSLILRENTHRTPKRAHELAENGVIEYILALHDLIQDMH
jgi:hypothetical protein